MIANPDCTPYLGLAVFGIILLGFWIVMMLAPIGLFLECMLMACCVCGVTLSMILIGRSLITAYQIHNGKPRTYPARRNLGNEITQLKNETIELNKKISDLEYRLELYESYES